jgi:hypothetical protein
LKENKENEKTIPFDDTNKNANTTNKLALSTH